MSDSLNLESLTHNLQKKQAELKHLLSKDVKAVKSAIQPWQDEMKSYLMQSPYNDFGQFLRKILKMPINTRQMVEEKPGSGTPLIIGRNFYYKNHGKKKVFPDEALFYAFSKKFADLITTGPKRNLVLDFLRFKLAVIKHLEPFTKAQVFPMPISVQTANVGCVSMSNGIVTDGQRAKVYNYIDGQETIKPKFISIYFPEHPEFHNQTVQKATDTIRYGNKMGRDFTIVISLFDQIDDQHFTLIGSTVITLDEQTIRERNKREDLSSLNLADLQLEILNKNVNPIPVRADLEFHSDTRVSFAESDDDFVKGGCVVQFEEQRNSDSRLRFLMPGADRVDLSKTIVTNWAEIIALPEVQNTVKSYLSTWNLISRAWSFMKQKYAYKVFLHGHF